MLMFYCHVIAEQGVAMVFSSKGGHLRLDDYSGSVCDGHPFKPCPAVLVRLTHLRQRKCDAGLSVMYQIMA